MRTGPDPSSVRFDGPWTHRDVHANGIRLHVAEAGDGPLLVLLHGFAGFWWTWRHQLATLPAAGLRVVAVDLRGYGDSDKPPRGYDAWTLAGDVAGLIKSLGGSRAHLAGHGWGGLVAWSVAALHPRLVRSLAVLSAPHPLALRDQIRRTALRGRHRNQARALGHVFHAQLPLLPERRLTRDDGAAVERLFRSWAGPRWQAQPDFAAAMSHYRAAMRVPGVAHSSLEYYRWAARSQLRSEGRRFAEALTRKLDTPVLEVYGAQDPCILPPSRTASTPWVTTPADHHQLPGIGHFPAEEAPAAVNSLLEVFLKGLD